MCARDQMTSKGFWDAVHHRRAGPRGTDHPDAWKSLFLLPYASSHPSPEPVDHRSEISSEEGPRWPDLAESTRAGSLCSLSPPIPSHSAFF